MPSIRFSGGAGGEVLEVLEHRGQRCDVAVRAVDVKEGNLVRTAGAVPDLLARDDDPIAVLDSVDGGRADAAAGGGAEPHECVDGEAGKARGQVSPKEGGGLLLPDYRLRRTPFEARSNSVRGLALAEAGQCWDLSRPQAGVGEIFRVIDGCEEHRHALLARDSKDPASGPDDAIKRAAQGAGRIGEAAHEVHDDYGRARAKADAMLEAASIVERTRLAREPCYVTSEVLRHE